MILSRELNIETKGDRSDNYFSKNNIQKQLDEADLATVKTLRSYFDKMPDVIRRYHLDHSASKEEAEIIANYFSKAANIIETINNNGDLIKLFEYLISLKGKLSQYNHKEYKYRWSVILENEVLTKLQQLSILQEYQKDRLDSLLIQQALERQFKKNNSNITTISNSLDNKNISDTPNNRNSKISENIDNDLKTKLLQFRQIYKQDKKIILDRLFAKVIITVETLESITIAFDRSKEIIFENSPHDKYWIIDFFNEYFLIPGENQKVDAYKLTDVTITKTLFDCSGYYPDYSWFQLIRPAVMTKLFGNKALD